MKLTLDFNFNSLDHSFSIDAGLGIMRSLIKLIDTNFILVNRSSPEDLDLFVWQDASMRLSGEFLDLLLPKEMVLDSEESKLFVQPELNEDWTPLLDQLRFDLVLEHPMFQAILCDAFDIKKDAIDDTAFTLGLFIHHSGEVLASQKMVYDFLDCEAFADMFSTSYVAQDSFRLGVFVGRLTDWLADQRVARTWLGKRVVKPALRLVSED